MLKKCGRCKQEKNKSDFHKCKHRYDGLHGWCKICVNKNAAEHYKKTKGKRKQYIKDRCLERRQRLYKFVDDIKSSYGCCMCSEKEACVLECHHLNPKTKVFCVALWIVKSSKTGLLSELEKCIVICSNCHKRHHLGKKPIPNDAQTIKLDKSQVETLLTRKTRTYHYEY